VVRERLPLYTGLLLALVTLVTFLPVTGHDFVRFDDPLYVTKNPQVQAGLTGDGLLWALTANVASNWHPLTLVSHMLDCQLYGMNPRGHHLTSLLLHVLNTVLLFEVLRRMTGSTLRSAIVAALFGLHPTHVESVAWVAERKDVLSGLFWILTMGAWHRYVKEPSRGRYATTMVCLALGLLSKPMVVTLPFVLLLLDVWPLRRGIHIQAHIKEKLPLFALSVASCVVTVVAQSYSLASTEAFPVSHRLANAVLSYVKYLWMTIAPHGLAVFYPMPLTFSAWKVVLAALLLAGLTALALLAVRRAPYVTVGWLWYLGTLVPVIGLIQVGGQAMADRYTYLPTIGLFLIAAWGLPERKTAMVAAAGAVLAIVALAMGTRLQLRYWVDSEALFRRAAAVTERNYLAHLNLAQILAEQNKQAEALEHFRQALAIRPGMWQTHASLGNSLRRWGRPAEALPSLHKAIALRPKDGKLHHSLAMALDDLGRTDEAIAELRKAVEISPGLDDAWYGLGILLRQKGDAAGALQNFQAAPESVRARLGGTP
jgi:tetratricopeptide (TPR) repeat protein